MIISQLVYECRFFWKRKDSFHPKVAAELYVGDSLAMIREAGVDDLQEQPQGASCHQPIFERLANWRGASWPSMWLQLDDLEAKIWENFVPLFFQALNSVGQQQHSTIWGWDADPAVLFRWWLRIAVCLLFFWLAQNYGRKRWTALTRICNTYISTVRVEYQKQLTYVPSKEVGIRWYQSFCATLLWDLGYQSLNTYPHQLYMYRAHLYRVTDVDYFLYMKEKAWSISSIFMWNHVTFSKVCGKAAGDEAEDEADDMEAPLIGKRLGGPWVGFNADFFTDNFRGFLWATAYTVLRKMTSNHRTFYTTFPREHLFLSKKKLGIWPWDKNWLLWSWHVFTAKKHNS